MRECSQRRIFPTKRQRSIMSRRCCFVYRSNIDLRKRKNVYKKKKMPELKARQANADGMSKRE